LPVSKPVVSRALLASGVLDDPDHRVRLAAYLALVNAPGTTEIGTAIVNAAIDSQNVNDRWLTRALEILARAHSPFFSDAYTTRFGGADPVKPTGLFIHSLLGGRGAPDGGSEPPRTVDHVVRLRGRLGKLFLDQPLFPVHAGEA